MRNLVRLMTILLLAVLFAPLKVMAQTTAFTYQGQLKDGANPANGSHDFQFKLFDTQAIGTGTQQGATVTLPNVTVTAGVFTAQLDFGAGVFTGAPRFLEIAVKPVGIVTFTVLGPRQPVTATPYAIKSLNAAGADTLTAACVNCVTGSQIQSLPAGSANYIQNSTTPQAASNFNLSGTGTANILDATTQYNLNGSRILSNEGFLNLFAGVESGAANTTGSANTFFGFQAGAANTTGQFNAFFGTDAGGFNTTGESNTFFGALAGRVNATGGVNAFFGTAAGEANTTGSDNAFFGATAGSVNTTGARNTFLGTNAGSNNTSGDFNTFVGYGTNITRLFGTSTSPHQITLIGTNATVLTAPIYFPVNATAIGAHAQVSASDALVLGGITGINGGTDTKVGIGTTAPLQKFHVKGQGLFTADNVGFDPGDGAGPAIRIGFNASGEYGYINANNSGVGNRPLALQPNANQGNVGIGTTSPFDRLQVIGDIRVGTSGSNGCLKNNNGGTITGTCSSDLRFKRDLTPFAPVLNRLIQLQPIHYFWRAAEFPDKHFGSEMEAGLIAQEVEQVLPELVSEDADGYKRVDYSQLPLLLLQAIKELKAEQEQLKQQLELHKQLNARKRKSRGSSNKLTR